MLKKFIERPVLSTVISVILVILGILGMSTLPVSQYPDIAPTTISVSTSYPGADAETVLESVVIPIEEKINGVEGMTYITSSATNTGRASITVYFKNDYDPDIAAVNVQNRVALANPLLPSEVKQIGVTTKKKQSSALMYLEFYSDNPKLKSTFIANYLNINVTPQIKRVDGVGSVNVYSSRTYAMRIWVKPDKLAAYGLEPSDIAAAIKSQSQEAAAGSLGENTGQTYSYTIRYSGRLNEVDEYKNIVIKALDNGKILRLKDVADIELGVENYGVTSKTLGHPSISMSINQTKGSNAHEIIDNIKEKLKKIKQNLPKGVKVFIPYDTNEFLNASINKVVETLLEAFILVFIVIFIFLQDFRSTLIPAIAVPVSIIGTFFFLNLFGYSINLLTLFALLLAIGLVVDDAIVVVEAVHAKLDEGATNVKKATVNAMDEIAGAIISITLVMASVFLPVTFIQGTTGIFFKQFGVTLMTAIVISAVNALTLSPALCAVFLKPKSEKGKKKGVLKRFYTAFNAGFSASLGKYTKSLHFFYKHKWITPVVILLAGFGIWWASSVVPTGFIPKEDRGIVMMDIQLPEGSSLDATVNINNKVLAAIKKVPGVSGTSIVGGYSMLAGAGSNHGLGFIKLAPFKTRKGNPAESVKAITGKLFKAVSHIENAQILFFSPPSIPGFSASGGYQVNLLDKSGGTAKSLDNQTQAFIKKLDALPAIKYAQSSFSTNYPQYEMKINVPLAVQSGVDVNSIFRTMQAYLGGMYTADLSKYGKQFRVYIQAAPKYRVKKSDLNGMYVRTKDGEMAPITQFVSLKRVYGPQSVTRFNLYNSSKISGAVADGYTTGDALKAIQGAAKELPANYGIAFSGLSREQVNSQGQTYIIFILVVVFTFFVLSAQYESYLIPFSILLSVPFGILGAYLGTMAMGLENNIYFQISMIMLIGLLAKNAILIVEFALQRRRQGETIFQSAIDGARVRLRPILMTSFAFIFGLLPLALAAGIGAEGNRSIGVSAVSGMLIGTVLGVFVVPILYVFFQWLQEKVKPMEFEKENPSNEIE